jgi:23S rRNA (adenine2503-C2)-methyltransferase
MLCHVNLIPLNPTSGYSGTATSSARVEDFQILLQKAGIPTSIRVRRGLDIQAGCGQLAAEEKKLQGKHLKRKKPPTGG